MNESLYNRALDQTKTKGIRFSSSSSSRNDFDILKLRVGIQLSLGGGEAARAIIFIPSELALSIRREPGSKHKIIEY
jgi:hypothetical protein